jgi:large subunit ribosomal protein L16
MALMPKRVKHRKQQRGRVRGEATRGNYVVFGEYGLQTLQKGWLSSQQIEAGRVAATHFLQGEGRIFIRVFPDKPISAQPAETRMGKGKGEPEYYAAVVRPGKVLYEIGGGLPEDIAKQALNRIAHKLPLRCRLVTRRIKV